MARVEETGNAQAVIDREGLDALIAVLLRQGYRVIGPRVADGAVVYEPVGTTNDLPAGWKDTQEGGRYRLARHPDVAAPEGRELFAHVVGPHTWKRYLYPPQQRLWHAQRNGGNFVIETESTPPPRYAFLGVRPCELTALAIQDRVFGVTPVAGDPAGVVRHTDSGYRARRDSAFIIAVQCGHAASTCFCASMNAGPRADSGFDLALTELVSTERHVFLVEVGSAHGATVLAELPHRPATVADGAAAQAASHHAEQAMTRQMVPEVDALLKRNLEHPRWAEVAERCLNCANCTMVCPTCFCTTVEDVTDLTGQSAERVRRWDSCFTLDFSYIHGGSLRRAGSARYRQWMTHKLSHWHDQFGVSGCTGCGRCITWCPVGIDITEEARAIHDSEGGR